jgi:hypothetical protein
MHNLTASRALMLTIVMSSLIHFSFTTLSRVLVLVCVRVRVRVRVRVWT